MIKRYTDQRILYLLYFIQHPKQHLDSAVFAHITAECPYTLQLATPPPSKLPLPMGHLDPMSYILPSVHQSPQPKWHLDQFRSFCRAH